MVLARNRKWPVQGALACLLLFCVGLASAATVCTSTDYPGSGKADVRSYRDVAVDFLNEQIQAGKQAEGRGELALAWRYYHTARLRFYHPQLGIWVNSRCAGESDYRRALQQLQGAGGKLAQRDLAAGKYLWNREDAQRLVSEMELENRQYLMLLGGGALEYNLRSYRYDDFTREFEPFVAGLKGDASAADGFSQLLLLIEAHKADLQQIVQEKETQQLLEQQLAQSGKTRRDDTLGLLPGEEAGYPVLRSSRDRVVKAIEANIAHWLRQEEQDFAAVEQAADMLSEMMTAEAAIDKLKVARKFPPLFKAAGDYKEGPLYSLSEKYEQDILARAEQRGDRLMAQEHSFAAKKYYSFAGARDKRDAADELSRKQGEAMKQRVEQSVKDGGKMFDAATDEERKQFDSETDAMADEFGL